MSSDILLMVFGWSSSLEQELEISSAAATAEKVTEDDCKAQEPCIWQLPQQSCSWGCPVAFCAQHFVFLLVHFASQGLTQEFLYREQYKTGHAAQLASCVRSESASGLPEHPHPLPDTVAAILPSPASVSTCTAAAPAPTQHPSKARPPNHVGLPVAHVESDMGTAFQLDPLHLEHRLTCCQSRARDQWAAYPGLMASVGWDHAVIAQPSKPGRNVTGRDGGGCWMYEGGAASVPVGVCAGPATVNMGLDATGRLGCQQSCLAERRRWLWQQLPTDAGPVVQVATGEHHTLALDMEGSVWAWGANEEWQCSVGQAAASANDTLRTAMAKGASAQADEQAAAGSHVNARPFGASSPRSGGITATGSTGSKDHDDCCDKRNGGVPCALRSPLGGTGPRQATPIVHVGLNVPVWQVACGARHSLAVDCRGGVWAWGWNAYGQCGVAALAAGGASGQAVVAAPVRVQGSVLGGVPCRAVAAGLGHSLALTEAGQVAAWGWNDAGQCGPADTGSWGSRRAAAHGSGTGDNASDRVAVGLGFVSEPQLVPILLPPHRVATATGSSAEDGRLQHSLHTVCGMKRGRTVCAGSGQDKDVEDDEDVEEEEEEGADEEEVVQISAGGRHSLALVADGRLYGWGSNSRGQLGPVYSGSDDCAFPRLVLPLPAALTAGQPSCVDRDLGLCLDATPDPDDAPSARSASARSCGFGTGAAGDNPRSMMRSGGQPAISVLFVSSACHGSTEGRKVGLSGHSGCEAAELLKREFGGNLGRLSVEAVQGGWSHTIVQCRFKRSDV